MMRGLDDKGSSSRNGSIDSSFPTPMGTVALGSGQGTLGEMDPVDNKLEGGECLLGYNLNRGLRSTRSSERTILLSRRFFIVLYRVIKLMNAPIH